MRKTEKHRHHSQIKPDLIDRRRRRHCSHPYVRALRVQGFGS